MLRSHCGLRTLHVSWTHVKTLLMAQGTQSLISIDDLGKVSNDIFFAEGGGYSIDNM